MQVAARVSVDGIQGMILASRALNPWDSDNGRDPSWWNREGWQETWPAHWAVWKLKSDELNLAQQNGGFLE